MKPAISLITLGVTDLGRARTFYESFGWALSKSSNEHVCFFKMNGTVLGLWSRISLAEDAGLRPHGEGFKGVSLAMNVASKAEVDEALAKAEAAGATVTQPAHEVFWGGYNGYFADPDGHLWEVAWNPGWRLNDDGTVVLP